MKFGRLDDISKVDFTLPADSIENNKVFHQQNQHPGKPDKKWVYIGCPVWADKGYVGKVYPENTKAKDYLYYYAKQFNCIELNATHYNIPSIATIQKWVEQTPPTFRFCPKFTNSISHSRDYGQQYNALERFLEAIYEFGERLGISFMQLPPYFNTERLESLHQFLGKLPKDMDIAVELRHPSWFADEGAKRALFEVLRSLNITAVITDAPGRRDVLHQCITTKAAFVRFLGNELHPTDYQRIDDWCHRLHLWLKAGLQEVYFFMHQPEKHLCADLSAYMINEMNDKYGYQLVGPQPFPKETQKGLFD